VRRSAPAAAARAGPDRSARGSTAPGAKACVRARPGSARRARGCERVVPPGQHRPAADRHGGAVPAVRAGRRGPAAVPGRRRALAGRLVSGGAGVRRAPARRGRARARPGGPGAGGAAARLDAQPADLTAALRYRILAEAQGNPLALIELPAATTPQPPLTALT